MFIKAEFKGQKRKFKLPDSCHFAELLKELVRCFGSEINQLELGYIDEDQEFIRITNDEEWEVCVEEFGIKNKSKQVNSLEIKIRESSASLTTSAAPNADMTQSFACYEDIKPTQELLKKSIDQWDLIGDSMRTEEPDVDAQPPKLGESISNIEPDLAQSEMTCEGFTLRQETPIIDELEIEEPEMKEEALPIIPKYTNTSNQDIVLDMKISGTPEELAKLQHSITHQFAPMAGFSIDVAQIEVKQEDANQSLLNSSSMTQELRDEIETMIEEKISKAMKKTAEPEKPKSTFNHFGVTCDNCLKIITNSCRFKSLVKKDFDICETCEATGVHPEPLIKIRAPLNPQVSWSVNRHFEELKAVFEGKQVKIQEQPQQAQPEVKAPCRGFFGNRASLAHIRPAQPQVEQKVTVADKFAEMGKMIPQVVHAPVPKPAPRPLAHIRTCNPPAPVRSPIESESEEFRNMHKRIMSVLPKLDKNTVYTFMKENEGNSIEELICKLLDEMKQ